MIYYYQDSEYNTHVVTCAHYWAQAGMECQLQKTYNHTSYIKSFTSTFFHDQEGWNYYYVIVAEGEPNVVNIYDFVRQKIIAEITYQGAYDA